MKEKIWFVFKLGDKHHRGPFSQQEINLLLQEGKLSDDIILWREGMKRWKSLDQHPEFNAPLASEQDAVSRPRKEIKTSLKEFHKKEREKEIPENFDESLAWETLQQASKKHIEETLKKSSGESSTEESDSSFGPCSDKAVKESYFIRIAIGMAIMFLVTFFIWPKGLFKRSTLVAHSLSFKDRRYLEQVVKVRSQKKSLFRMAINKNRDQLWLASNYKGEGRVFLTLISNPKKTLSLGKITITSQAFFRQGYARFTHFTLVKGSWPIPGEYQAKVYLYPKNSKQQVVMWKGIFILPPKGKQSLSESLKRWKKNIYAHYLSPLKNQYQLYKTLRSQLIRMEDFYKKSVHAKTWQEFVTRFEQHYNREVGTLLQRFILDGRHLHLSLFNSDIANSREYEKIFLYGKKIGVLASDMVTQIGQGVIKEPEKSRIGKSLLFRLDELVERSDSALKELQEKMDYYQKELPKR